MKKKKCVNENSDSLQLHGRGVNGKPMNRLEIAALDLWLNA